MLKVSIVLLLVSLFGCAKRDTYIKATLVDGTSGYRLILDNHEAEANKICKEGFDVIKRERDMVVIRCLEDVVK